MPTTWRRTGLPIETILPEIDRTLTQANAAVLCAEPGAGKTTIVPLALLDSAWLPGQAKILMLQPRRVAARAAAERMAELLGETVGQRVGYRMSLESRIGPHTRIEVLTEGVLTRMLQADPGLAGVSLVIFDEFHERSLQADLGLALTLEARDSLRPDLRILVMSATLDSAGLAGLIAPPDQSPAAILTCPGRQFAVSVRWENAGDYWRDPRGFAAKLCDIIRRQIDQTSGNILVFLPGVSEIRRVANGITGVSAEILSLHGSLSARDQAAILRPSARRRVILATNIAETSLTLEGISLVIDGGLARINRFDQRLGMDRLVTERVSLAASRQRQGRAGRTSQGSCIKLWLPDEKLEAWTVPESQRADLSGFVLEAAAWGIRDPSTLRVLTAPSQTLWQQATALLTSLGALEPADGSFNLSPVGRAMADLPMHPRLAAMLIAAKGLGRDRLAAACAAALADRDIFGPDGGSSFEQRVSCILDSGRATQPGIVELRQAQLDRCRELYRQWTHKIPASQPANLDEVGDLMALAYPDRIGKLQSVEKDHAGRLVAAYLLSNGRLATLAGPDAQNPPAWLVAIDADAGDSSARIHVAATIDSPENLRRICANRLQGEIVVGWDGMKPRLKRLEWLGKLLISEKAIPIGPADGSLVQTALIDRIRREGLDILPWDDANRACLQRLRWAATTLQKHQAATGKFWPGQESQFVNWDDAWLNANLEQWLSPFLSTNAGAILDNTALQQAIAGLVDWRQAAWLEREVPTHLVVPSGSRKAITYRENDDPLLAVRIQELFGLAQQPRILGISLILDLLSPAQRPLQRTADLEGFWSRTWPEIRKEMRGRYPRHYWPDNPLEAEPTARAKPRGT